MCALGLTELYFCFLNALNKFLVPMSKLLNYTCKHKYHPTRFTTDGFNQSNRCSTKGTRHYKVRLLTPFEISTGMTYYCVRYVLCCAVASTNQTNPR